MKKILLVLFLLIFFNLSCYSLAESQSIVFSDIMITKLLSEEIIPLHSFFTEVATNNDYSLNTWRDDFSIENIQISGINYERISGTSWITEDNEYAFTFTLEYKCHFGEEMKDSQVLISTVNAYESKYKSISTAKNKELDELLNRKSIAWKDEDNNFLIYLCYYHGDVSEMKFPKIEISFSHSRTR